MERGPKEDRVVLHFDLIFNVGGDLRFDFVGFLLKKRGRKRAVGWVSIWEKRGGGGERRTGKQG